MQQNYNMLFSSFDKGSKVWVYRSSRLLTTSEISYINKTLVDFVSHWSTHGKKLMADSKVLLGYFVVFVVDESNVQISGCSIDKSVHIMQSIGQTLGIDFFDRMSVLSIDNNEFSIKKFQDVRNDKNSSYFNPMISNLDQLRHHWIIQNELE